MPEKQQNRLLLYFGKIIRIYCISNLDEKKHYTILKRLFYIG